MTWRKLWTAISLAAAVLGIAASWGYLLGYGWWWPGIAGGFVAIALQGEARR